MFLARALPQMPIFVCHFSGRPLIKVKGLTHADINSPADCSSERDGVRDSRAGEGTCGPGTQRILRLFPGRTMKKALAKSWPRSGLGGAVTRQGLGGGPGKTRLVSELKGQLSTKAQPAWRTSSCLVWEPCILIRLLLKRLDLLLGHFLVLPRQLFVELSENEWESDGPHFSWIHTGLKMKGKKELDRMRLGFCQTQSI